MFLKSCKCFYIQVLLQFEPKLNTSTHQNEKKIYRNTELAPNCRYFKFTQIFTAMHGDGVYILNYFVPRSDIETQRDANAKKVEI